MEKNINLIQFKRRKTLIIYHKHCDFSVKWFSKNNYYIHTIKLESTFGNWLMTIKVD